MNDNNSITFDVSSSDFYADVSKDWAISMQKVQGIDFSSKYYAVQSQSYAQTAGDSAGYIESVMPAIEEVNANEQNIKTAALNILNINITAGSIAAVNAVSGSISNINAVYDALGAVNNVSSNITAVNTVSGISSAVSNVSSISSAVSSVSENASNINTVSNNINKINTTASNIANINITADNISNINAAGASIANINAVSGALTAVNNVSNNISAVNNVSGSISNINAVSADLANIDAAARHLTNIDNAQIWAEGSDAQVQAIGGMHSAKGWAESSSNADISLSNLNDNGNAKFQYAPFAINSGSIDSSGNNNTLITPGGVPVSVNKDIIPELSSNSSEYGICNDYTLTLPARDGNEADSNPFTMELADDNHIPSGASVTLTLKSEFYLSQPGSYTISNGCQGCAVTYTYTDNTTEKIYDENASGNFAGWGYGMSGVHSAEFVLPIASKEVKGISITFYTIPGGTEERLWVWGVTFKAQYIMSSSDTLICSPCTITTADGKTKTFNADNVLNINENPSNPIANYTVIGSPVISSDFIASGFSSGNYLQAAAPYNIFVAKFNYLWNGVNPSGSAFIFRYLNISEDNGINVYQADDGRVEVNTRVSSITYYDFGRFTITANKPLNIIITKTSTSLKIDAYQNDVNIFTKTVTSNVPSFDDTSLALIGNTGNPLPGSSDLKAFKIYVDGELEYSAVNQADGNYKVLKSYEDGSLKLVNSLAIQKTPPASGLWLDNSRSPLMLKNFRVIGSPVISADGIASGFSSSNTINLNASINAAAANVDYYMRITPADDTGTRVYKVFFGSSNENVAKIGYIINQNRALQFYKGLGGWSGSSYYLSLGVSYDIHLNWNGTEYKLYAKRADEDEWTAVTSWQTNTNILTSNLFIGRNSSNGNEFLSGSIDLKAFKIYVDNKLVYEAISNDVYIGDASVSGGVITAVKNNYFNACPAFRYPVETYQSGASWYEIYSDGRLRQGGYFTNTLTSAGETSITFLKSFKDTNYSFSRSMKTLSDAQNSDAFSVGWISKTPSAITFYSHANNLAAGYDWIAEGI